jgi:hypothetical protein
MRLDAPPPPPLYSSTTDIYVRNLHVTYGRIDGSQLGRLRISRIFMEGDLPLSMAGPEIAIQTPLKINSWDVINGGEDNGVAATKQATTTRNTITTLTGMSKPSSTVSLTERDTPGD